MTKRIAMWSGPRNLSTAMMYSFAQRTDCSVIDEPFYGVYLQTEGLNHPMREDVMKTMPSDPDAVISDLLGPGEAPVMYQKHMCQHMLPTIPREWIAEVTNVFLIRHPARVIASFGKKVADVTAQDIGFEMQVALFEACLSLGQTPLVIDSSDVRANPEGAIKALCAALDVDFDPAMLSWPKGGNAADGVWAPVWYDAIHNSSGFAGAEGPLPELDGPQSALLETALPQYHAMKERAISL